MNKLMIKIEIDGYVVGTFTDHSLFIARPDGEGMEIGNEEFKQLLEKYLADNF